MDWFTVAERIASNAFIAGVIIVWLDLVRRSLINWANRTGKQIKWNENDTEFYNLLEEHIKHCAICQAEQMCEIADSLTDQWLNAKGNEE